MKVEIHQLPIHDADTRRHHRADHFWLPVIDARPLDNGPICGGFKGVQKARNAVHDQHPDVEVDFKTVPMKSRRSSPR